MTAEFQDKPYLYVELPNSRHCSRPARSQHLRQSGGNTPRQRKADSLPCLFMNTCERSTVSRKADCTTFKLGRQTVLVPWDIKKKTSKKQTKKAVKNHTISSHSATCSVSVSQLPTAEAIRNTDTSLTANQTPPRLPTGSFRKHPR